MSARLRAAILTALIVAFAAAVPVVAESRCCDGSCCDGGDCCG